MYHMLPSHILEIDVAIFVFFFLIITIVGVNYRGLSDSFREYAVGDKSIPTHVLIFTIVATWLSGSMFFLVIEGTYSQGWYFILASLIGIPGGLFIVGNVLGPHMGKFLNNFSAPDMLGAVYGRKLQSIFAICFVLTEIGCIAIQFKVIARTINTILQCDPIWAAAVSAMIVIIYSAHGGIKAVTFTAVVKFMTFCILIPILIFIMISNLKTDSTILESFAAKEEFKFGAVSNSSRILESTSYGFYMLFAPLIGAGLFQRLLMARDTKQIKKSTKISSIVILIAVLLMVVIAVLVFAENPNLEPNKIVDYLANRYPYEGLKGLFAVGIVALAMSNADSTLNACAVMISHDILPEIGSNKDNRILRAKISSYVIGLLALVLALKVDGLLNILLLTANFSLPILFIPLLSLILGFETSRRVVYMAISAGALATIWSVFYIGGVNSFIPGLLANAIVFFGAHYILGEKGGWGNNTIK